MATPAVKAKPITAHTRDFSLAFHQMFRLEPMPDSTPMYSYERPASMFWSAFMNGLMAGGFSEQEARDWLTSKSARYALDGDLGDAISDMAFAAAKAIAKPEAR